MALLDLPPELIELILTFLPAFDILKLGQCCRKLREITLHDVLWEECARRDYSIDLRQMNSDVKESKHKSARQFYLEILVPFGSSLQTIWQLSILLYA